MINFLISIVSQTHQEVMSKSTMNKYRHQALLNRECRLLKKNQCKTYEYMIVSCAQESNIEVNKWQGFLVALKSYIFKQNNSIKHFLKDKHRAMET